MEKSDTKEAACLKHVDLFTDGACSGNPGPGGYGTILRYNGNEKELSAGEESTTNNRMELTGVISALRALKAGKTTLGAIPRTLAKAGLRVDYVACVDAATLEPRKQAVKGACVLVAAYAGRTRLIDNIVI